MKIENSVIQLIEHLEEYKKLNGHYPLSLEILQTKKKSEPFLDAEKILSYHATEISYTIHYNDAVWTPSWGGWFTYDSQSRHWDGGVWH